MHASDKGIGMAAKNSLEIIIKQVHLEGSFKRGSRIRVVECLRQIIQVIAVYFSDLHQVQWYHISQGFFAHTYVHLLVLRSTLMYIY